MVFWGKVIGGMAGFAMGGPFGAMVGAALGHAADTGLPPKLRFLFPGFGGSVAKQARAAAMRGQKQQVFSIAVVVLSAKLAKCDGPVKRTEIDMFRRQFRIPEENAQSIGRLFDQARESAEGYESFAAQLGLAFADNKAMLEQVLFSLFAIARADGPINGRENAFLLGVYQGFGLDQRGWDRASGAAPSRPSSGEADPYEILGIARSATGEELRAAWKKLMRENHPDALAARGVAAEFIEKATASVARINAAWDQIKRERGL